MPDLLPQLMMQRDLQDLPALQRPAGISIRACGDGDDAAWEAITDDAFERAPTPGRFHSIMRSSRWFRPERVLFLRDGYRPVATASAWVEETYGPDAGVLHYVAVRRASHGRQFGRHVSLAAMHVMAREGHRRVVLRTDDDRIPAIRLYLKLGFVPFLVHENQRERWGDVLDDIQRKDLIQSFAEILNGPVEVA